MSIFPLLALGGGAAAVVADKKPPAQDLAATAQAGVAAAVTQRPTLGNGLLSTLTIQQVNSQGKQSATAPPGKIHTNLGPGFALIHGAKNAAPFGTKQDPSLVGVTQGSYGDLLIKQKLDAINAYGKQAYDQLSADAKKAGAKALSDQLGLDPPLKGDESWETIASVAGGAAGGAVGAYIGGPLGAKIGAMIGAYLGVKLEELINKDLDKIGDWFKSQWQSIEDWASGEASDAYNTVSDWVGSIV